MSKTLTAARQVVFDTDLVKRIKRLESLASPGSYATFQGGDDALVVTFHGGKGGEIESRRKFDVPCGAPFTFTIQGKSIMDILKAFDEVTMTVKEKTLSFQSGHSRMNRNIQTDAPEVVFPDFSKEELAPLPQTTFRDAALASYATAQGGESDVAERVSIFLTKGSVSIVGTNGLMAVRVVSPSDYSGEDKEYLLHPRFIDPLAPLSMKEGAPTIFIGRTERKYLVKFGEYEITSRIPASPSLRTAIEGNLNLMANSQTMGAAFDVDALLTFFERAKLLDVGATQVMPVVFMINPDEGVALAKHKSPLGDIQDMFDIEVSGTPMPNMPLGFSLKYFTEACNHLRSDTAEMTIRSQRAPVTLAEKIEDTLITHILLPVLPRTDEKELAAEKKTPAQTKDESSSVSPSDFED